MNNISNKCPGCNNDDKNTLHNYDNDTIQCLKCGRIFYGKKID